MAKTFKVKLANGQIAEATHSGNYINIPGVGSIPFFGGDLISKLRAKGISTFSGSAPVGSKVTAGASGGGRPGAGNLDGLSGGLQSDLSASYQEMIDKANAKNEERYQEIKGGYDARYSRNLANIDQVGNSERQRIADEAAAAKGTVDSRAADRGLTNTSVVGTGYRGVERNADRARGALEDRLLQDRIRVDAGLSGDTLSFMERREDIAPDLNQLIALQTALGQGGYGQRAGYGFSGGYGYGGGGGTLGLSSGGGSGGGGGRLGRLLDRNARWDALGLDGDYRASSAVQGYRPSGSGGFTPRPSAGIFQNLMQSTIQPTQFPPWMLSRSVRR